MSDSRALAAPMQQLAEVQSRGCENVHATVRHLVEVASKGLVSMFDQERQLYCYRLRKTDGGLVREGVSPRYTMMTLMGLYRLREAGGVSPIESNPILERLLSNLDWVNDIGDLGLLLWLCALIAPERLRELESRLEIKAALIRYRSAKQGVTMELAWFLTGLSYWGSAHPEKLPELKDLTFATYAILMKNQGTHGFFGHLAGNESISGVIRGRIGSFADQVYPIYAMTQFSRAYQSEEAAERALDSALALCRAQGPLGQWWWHYNAESGQVVEGYPVFSVHQHGMGPMALFALGDAVHYDFSPWIHQGLRWIDSQNELQFDMEDASGQVIWRSIFRSRHPSGNYLRAILGRRLPFTQQERAGGFRVLYECRPYELGWLLYAFASRF